MKNINEVSSRMFSLFGTNQSFHAEQENDGRYYKKNGRVTVDKIKWLIESKSSIAVYQRNTNSTIKWICYDFDIIKAHVESELRDIAEQELKKSVKKFCDYLDIKGISYLIEFSGNRGFHIWLTFDNEVDYKVGHEILEVIYDDSNLNINNQLLSIDLFPSSRKITNGVGSGVKLPLSKHKKSGFYSYFMGGKNEIDNIERMENIDDDFLGVQLEIINVHHSISKSKIEEIYSIFLSTINDNDTYQYRIKEVVVESLDLEEMIEHWRNSEPLSKLASKITEGKLSNNERKLLVGLLSNAIDPLCNKVGEAVLIKIFEKQTNYNKDITNKAIKALSSFYFPSQTQVEEILEGRFTKNLSAIELLNFVFYNLKSFDQGLFDFCEVDIKVTRIAEMNYLVQNDEAQSRKIINDLANLNSSEYLSFVNSAINEGGLSSVDYYQHIRLEGNKKRELVTLDTNERMLTSLILKQLNYFYDIEDSDFTHGYRVNKGFKNGYIFEQWLYLWVKFLSNISTAISDEGYSNCYIVKTDIKGFYENISHDKLKRLLLDGVSSNQIDRKISSLDSISTEKYKKLIDICMNITKEIVKKDKGLPQGPAYARFFAELYLTNIDSYFERKINNDEIILYQRYVDDFFFICNDETEAREYLEVLTNLLKELGLSINNNKTIIKKVKDFTPDYDKYRSQSKYSVDKISHRFDLATDREKDLAINEFIKLISSEAKQDDLSFIYSHLKGIEAVEAFKNEQIRPTIDSGLGRGSLYRNLFNHILENENIWYYLTETREFNSLQSEVLTSIILHYLEDGKSSHDKFKWLISELVGKLVYTKMVKEHLLQISLLINWDVNLNIFDKAMILDVIAGSANVKNTDISEGLIEVINTELNSMKDKYKFIDIMYALCNSRISSNGMLSKLSSIFYSFTSLYMNNYEFEKKEHDINETLTFSCKYYYLTCLFSLSEENKSTSLLISMWRYCACLFNKFSLEYQQEINLSWVHKIDKLNIDSSKSHLLLASILDGAIFRGVEDNKAMFKKYHTLVLIFMSSKISELKDDNITKVLNKVKETSKFYEWIIDNNGARFLPEDRSWFDSNIIENNVIMLKKDSDALFRKPNEDFLNLDSAVSTNDGYAELLVSYIPNELSSAQQVLSGLTLKDFIKLLTTSLSSNSRLNTYPNIFSKSRLVKSDTLEPFSNELYNVKNLLLEDQVTGVLVKDNNIDNYIECIFSTLSGNARDSGISLLKRKYIPSLPREVDKLKFFENLEYQLDEFSNLDDITSPFYLDLAISSAVYSSLEDIFVDLELCKKFIDFYFVANSEAVDKHIFSVEIENLVSDADPENLLDTLINSVQLTKTKAFPPLVFNLDDIFLAYKETLEKLINDSSTEEMMLSVKLFKKSQIELRSFSKHAVLGDGTKFEYDNVRVINVANNSIIELTIYNSFYIESSSQKYTYIIDGILFIIAIPSAFSKIYDEVYSRFSCLTNDRNKSYQPYQFDKDEIEHLKKFDDAVNVISIHRDISYGEASKILLQWLASFPSRFREMFVLLIAAHICMQPEEIDSFCDKTLELINNNRNAFLIKKVEDYNGTIRCFKRNDMLCRLLGSLDPNNLRGTPKDITIIVDTIITGSQLFKAIEYYFNQSQIDDNYYANEDATGEPLGNKLRAVEVINICCVFYRHDSLDSLKARCLKFIPTLKRIQVIHGRDIGDDALLSSTSKIGNSDKEMIVNVLENVAECKSIYSLLDHKAKRSKEIKRYTELKREGILGKNLIARYQSLPKKCFEFLYIGLKSNDQLHPMNRVCEVNDIEAKNR